MHKCRSEHIIQTTNEREKKTNQTLQPLELNKDLKHLGRYAAPFKEGKKDKHVSRRK